MQKPARGDSTHALAAWTRLWRILLIGSGREVGRGHSDGVMPCTGTLRSTEERVVGDASARSAGGRRCRQIEKEATEGRHGGENVDGYY